MFQIFWGCGNGWYRNNREKGKREKRALISAMGNGKDIPETRENYIANYQIILRIGE